MLIKIRYSNNVTVVILWWVIIEFENICSSLQLIYSLVSQLPSFQAGDKVRVLSDKQRVQNLQQGHGGWNESMTAVRNFYLDFLEYIIRYFSSF